MKFFRLLVIFSLFLPTAKAWDAKNMKEEALSPFTTKARNIFYIGAGLTLTVLAFEDSIIDYTQKDLANDKPLEVYQNLEIGQDNFFLMLFI